MKAAATLLGSLLLVACAAPALAQDEFYRGKTLTVIVGSSAGGAYDQYARAVGKHMARHIPGNPAPVVQNMPGAGSLTAVRHLDANAPKDGTVIVTFNPSLILQSMVAPEVVKLRFTDLYWLGAVTEELRVCYAWHTTGLRSWSDVMGAPRFVLGASAAGTGAYVNGAVLQKIFGMKVHQILGYSGASEARLATERGELDGGCTEYNAIPEAWIRERKINNFVRWLKDVPADFPRDVPFITDLAERPEDKDLLTALTAPYAVGNPFLASRQVPRDRLEMLRKAFAAAMADKAFRAEAAEQKMPLEITGGAEAERLVASIYATATPALIERMKEVMK